MAATILILGGGFGGIAAANKLRELLPAPHRVILVDQSDKFFVGATKTWVMLGEKNVDEITQSRAALLAAGVEFVYNAVASIDVAGCTITTPDGVLAWDFLVVALGADVSMDGVPGLKEAAHTFYTLEGAERLRSVVADFKGGDIAILMVKPPWKCPPAPYEAAMMLHALFAERGVPARISIHTPEGIPMATAGPEMGAFIKSQLEARGITLHAKRQVTRVDGESRRVHFADGAEAAFDLLLCVPVHAAPAVVRQAGLTGGGAWIPVHARTMEVGLDTAVGRVFAVGDVTTVSLPGRFKPDMPLVLPKAGVMAEAQALVAAHRIADLVEGRVPSAEFDGRGFCYLEMGRGEAVRAEGSFFNMPHPVMEKHMPDAAQLQDKHDWVAAHLRPIAR
ncbi:MAG TPA: FAD/NAD(P)-binding oxidoreductase [Opitutaceae bacterium]|nr:FAD/NAD(P)-binding oxidoreductase [Opitutaceae bacterium]